MKILIVSDIFGHNTTTFIQDDLNFLLKKQKVKYLCIERMNFDLFPFQDVKIAPYRESKIFSKIKFILEKKGILLNFKNRIYSRYVNNFLDEYKPDVVHCHFGYEALRFYQNLNSYWKSNLKIFVTFHGFDASQHLQRNSYVSEIKKMLRMKNVFTIVVCQFLLNNLLNKGIQFNSVKIIHCGVDLLKFKVPENNFINRNQEVLFFNASRMVLRKGQIQTVQAFNLFCQRYPEIDAKLVLGGDGPLLAEIRDLITSEKLENKIQLLGWMSHDEVLNYLNNVSVYVQHSVTVDSTTEGIPVALMEALAMGLPVVSTVHAGIPELIENGVHGFLSDENDIDRFAENLYLSLSLIGKVATLNRRHIENNFSSDIHNMELLNYYKLKI